MASASASMSTPLLPSGTAVMSVNDNAARAVGDSKVDLSLSGSADAKDDSKSGRINILLTAIGSRGDVQPMVALALGLQAHNPKYDVDVGADVAFEKFVRDAHLPYAKSGARPLGYVAVHGNMEEWLATTVDGKAMRETKNPLKVMGMVKKAFAPLITIWWNDLLAGMRAKKYDLCFLTGVSPTFATGMMEAFPDVRLVYGFLFPAVHATSAFLPATMSKYQAPCGCLNRVMWDSLRGMAAGIYDDTVNGLRTKTLGYDQDGKQPYWGTLNLCDEFPVTVVDGYSSVLVPKPRDWPSHHHITGAFFMPPRDSDERLHPLLEAFLDDSAAGPHRGQRALYIGLGSMMSCFMERDRTEAVGRIMAEAARRLSRRALILTSGWTAEAKRVFGVADLLSPATTQEERDAFAKSPYAACVMVAHAVPHELVFSRVDAIVTHGGAGTTHAALRAGKPVVFVPFGADQPWWGQLAVSKGLSPPNGVIFHTDLNADNLTAALHVACTDRDLSRRCAEVGALIRGESGVRNAVALLEQELQTQPAGPFSREKRPREWAVYQEHMRRGPPKSYAGVKCLLFVAVIIVIIVGATTHWFGLKKSDR